MLISRIGLGLSLVVGSACLAPIGGSFAVAQPAATPLAVDAYDLPAESPWLRQARNPNGTKVIGGQAAKIENWRGIAALRFSDPKGNASHFCGGVMIASHWLLTAAHCLQSWRCDWQKAECEPFLDGDLDMPAHNIKGEGRVEVVVGVNDLRKPLPAGSKLRAEKGYIFKAYAENVARKRAGYCTQKGNDCPAEFGNDIALVKLADKYEGNFARLSKSQLEDPPELEGVRVPVGIAGFGRTMLGGADEFAKSGDITVVAPSMTLMETLVPTKPLAECSEQYRPNYKLQKSQICSIVEKSRETCSGDSGGPLVGYDRNNRPYVVGLTSWGVGCGRDGYAGVYTRVSSKEFQDWLRAKGITAEGLKSGQMFDYAAARQAFNDARKIPDAGNLKLEICSTGRDLDCTGRPSALLPSAPGDNRLVMKVTAGRSNSGNLVIFVVTAVGRVEQYFPRGQEALEPAVLGAGKEMVVPRASLAVTSGFPFDWDIEDGMLFAILLPANSAAKAEIEAAGKAKGVPADPVQYVKVLTKAAALASPAAEVARIAKLQR